jgi:hypothetical protein
MPPLRQLLQLSGALSNGGKKEMADLLRRGDLDFSKQSQIRIRLTRFASCLVAQSVRTPG